MGAWGFKAFDNDDANDWSYGLEKVSDFSIIKATFAQVNESEKYLESPVACEALAACEVLAQLMGQPGYKNSYTATVDQWVQRDPTTPPTELMRQADAIIDRILGENSELRQLWEEGDASEWLREVENLRGRLHITGER